ncbi:unnamed protein product [Cylindrotheca closterium]|uniref:UBC core domain-containing protein n=1 Tax=Cylindrotheca closterium TaxID=2856 RepID=A0AAD2JK37_9STRA|nr:unnamed protein product [Cylindrotheca closterium]
MKRVYGLIGVSALFLRQDAVASSGFNKPSASISLPFDAKGDVEISHNEATIEKPTNSSISSPLSEDPLDLIKPEKRSKKETAEKKKPTTSKTAQSSGSSSSSSKSSSTLRRIKKEYEDAVNMGICYDWAKQKLVKQKKGATVNDQEYRKLICVGPLVSNLRHWHFSFRGCGIYERGIYHGRIILPKDYPASPPRVQLWTPSGRFVPQHDICLSASSYHPESWTPRWTILAIIQALRLHMLTNPQEIGGKLSSLNETLDYAKESLKWWAKFNAGKHEIEINHEILLQQEVLSFPEPDGETRVDESTNNVPVGETTKTDIEAVEIELEKEPTSPQAFEPKSSKRSQSKKKNRKSKKQGERGSAVIHETARMNELATSNPVLALLSKVIGSPFRIALFSLLLFFWVVSSSTT